MFTDHTLILINVACIGFLLIMLIVLAAATRMKSGATWAAMIMVTTTVPVYLANLTRDLASDYFILFLYPSITLNTLCFPSFWFFTRSRYDKSFRLVARDLLHLVLPLVSLISHIVYYVPLTAEQIEAERAFMEAGSENLPAIINDVIVFGGFFVYVTFIYLYIRKRKKFLQDNYSDSEYIETKWIPRLLSVFFVLFFVVLVAYVINPRTDAWLIPILNVIAMAYLVYCVVFHSTTAYINRLSDTPAVAVKHEKTPSLPRQQMKEICERALNYLASSGAYTNPDFSLAMLSVETAISPRNLSYSLNDYLKKSFFDLINEMRVEEAQKRLRSRSNNFTIDSIAVDCGFRSRSSFYTAFRKVEGMTPSQWLKSILSDLQKVEQN